MTAQPATLTLEEIEALEKLEAEATQRTSKRWCVTGAKDRDDGTAQVYAPNRGPMRVIVPIAETTPEEAELIAAARNALPALLRLARREMQQSERLEMYEGARAPVQGSRYETGKNGYEDRARPRVGPGAGPGSIAWNEHLAAWSGYAAQYPGQSAMRMAERGGFSYAELIMFLGREPKTWTGGQMNAASYDAWMRLRKEPTREDMRKRINELEKQPIDRDGNRVTGER